MNEMWKPDWSELTARAQGRDEVMEFARPELVQEFYPMGLRVRLETNHPDILAAACESFARYPTPRVPPDVPDITLRLFVQEVDDGIEAARRARSVFRVQEHYFCVTAGRDAMMMGDQARGRVFGFLPPSLVSDHQYVRHHFIEAGFYVILMTRGFVGVYGAGLAKDGRAILLRGWQGTGKSTLAFACVRRGWQLLGEDKVWAHWASPAQEWWGAPWTLSLLPDAQHFFPELAAQPVVPMSNGEQKIVLDLDQIAPNAVVMRTASGVLVFLERHMGTDSHVSALTPPQAFHHFLNPICEPAGPSHVGYTTAVEQLLARPSYRLQLGTQLDAAVDALEELLTMATFYTPTRF